MPTPSFKSRPKASFNYDLRSCCTCYTHKKRKSSKRGTIYIYIHTHTHIYIYTHTYMYHLCQLMHEDYWTKKNLCLWVGLWSSLGVIPMRSMRSGYAVCWPTHFQLARIHNSKLPLDFSSVTQSCPTFCKPMDCSTPGLPIHHQPPELAQTHVHQVSDAIQPSHPLLSPSPPAFNLSTRLHSFKKVSLLIIWFTGCFLKITSCPVEFNPINMSQFVYIICNTR